MIEDSKAEGWQCMSWVMDEGEQGRPVNGYLLV
jgi:hypothetical protein